MGPSTFERVNSPPLCPSLRRENKTVEIGCAEALSRTEEPRSATRSKQSGMEERASQKCTDICKHSDAEGEGQRNEPR
jgi:hypothetical protein